MTMQFKNSMSSYVGDDAVRELLDRWKPQGWHNLKGFVLIRQKKCSYPTTFAFVEPGPLWFTRIRLATIFAQEFGLPFYNVVATDYDGIWRWENLRTGVVTFGTRREFQSFICKLNHIEDTLTGDITPDMHAELLANPDRWIDLAVREIGHEDEIGKIDIDNLIVDQNFHPKLVVEGKHDQANEQRWNATKKFGDRILVPSRFISYDNAAKYGVAVRYTFQVTPDTTVYRGLTETSVWQRLNEAI